jgi:hypothetical protein
MPSTVTIGSPHCTVVYCDHRLAALHRGVLWIGAAQIAVELDEGTRRRGDREVILVGQGEGRHLRADGVVGHAAEVVLRGEAQRRYVADVG